MFRGQAVLQHSCLMVTQNATSADTAVDTFSSVDEPLSAVTFKQAWHRGYERYVMLAWKLQQL